MKSKVLRKIISTVLLSAFLWLPVADGLAHGDCGIDNRSPSFARNAGETVFSALSISPKPICNDCSPVEKNGHSSHCAVCLLHAHALVNHESPQVNLSSTSFESPALSSRPVEPVFIIYEPPKA